MRKTQTLLIIFLAVLAIVFACSKSKVIRIEERPTLMEANPGNGGYFKKVVLVLQRNRVFAANQDLGSSFLEKATKSIKSQSSRLRLITSDDPAFPAFLGTPDSKNQTNFVFALTRKAKLQGYNGIVTITIVDIQTGHEKRGFWKWRKTSYFLTLSGAIELIDTVTAAKALNQIIEEKYVIPESEYQAFQNGQYSDIAVLKKALADIASEFGDQAAAAIRKLPWRTAISSVEGNRINLAVGKESGLSVGDRFKVFEGRSVIDGLDGAKYIAPGYFLGRIEITEVLEQSALAIMKDEFRVTPDDIVAPTN